MMARRSGRPNGFLRPTATPTCLTFLLACLLCQVVFIALPAADDLSPETFLEVQAYDVRPSRRRGPKGPQVSFVFNPVDVGGLDREFIEQSITLDPEGAWRAVNGAEPDVPAPGGADDDGISPDEPMTPRTAAAQRL
jgi:hypothetical protein